MRCSLKSDATEEILGDDLSESTITLLLSRVADAETPDTPSVQNGGVSPWPSPAPATENSAQRYSVRIIVSDAGTSLQEEFSLSDDTVVYGPGTAIGEDGATLAQIKEALNLGEVEPSALEKLGEYLYKLLFRGHVKEKFEEVRRSQDAPYRMCILIDRSAPALEVLPWEYLREPYEGYLAFNGARIVRVLDDRPPKPFTSPARLRMLLAYANPRSYVTSDQEHDFIEQEIQSFVEHMERLAQEYDFDLEVLGHARKSQFLEAIKVGPTRGGRQGAAGSGAEGAGPDENLLRLFGDASAASTGDGEGEGGYHVVHFVGHGDLIGGKGRIVLEADGPGSKEYVLAEEIQHKLDEASPPRLFYFNACSTGRPESTDAFSSAAQVLLKPARRSVPAVVAMQYTVGVADSLQMAKEFYANFLDFRPECYGDVEAALSRARQAIAEKSLENVSWGIPILFQHAREKTLLFGTTSLPPPPTLSQLKSYVVSSVPPTGDSPPVNRTAAIQAVRDFISSAGGLLILKGWPGMGRATVVRSALEPGPSTKHWVIWLQLEGLTGEESALEAIYLAVDDALKGKLDSLWRSKHQLTFKLEQLFKLMPRGAVLVLEDLDITLDDGGRFREKDLEELFRHCCGAAAEERQIHVIATTQVEPTLGSEALKYSRLSLGGLELEDAVRLMEREGAQAPEAQLRQLAADLEGYPQALIVIARSLSEGAPMPSRPQSVAGAELGPSHAQPEGLNRFIIEKVLRVLSDEERALVERWSVFRNPVSLEGLLHGEDDPGLIESAAQTLVAKTVLRRGDDAFYSIPLPLRRAAYSSLKSKPEWHTHAHLRAAGFFEEKAFESASGAVDDMLEAYYHYHAAENKISAQELADRLFQRLVDAGKYRELEAVAERELCDRPDDWFVRLFRARAEWMLGKFDKGLNHLRLLEQSLEEGSYEQGLVLNEMGVALKERSQPDDYPEMLSCFDRAYDVFANVIRNSTDIERVKDCHRWQADTIYNRALIHQYYLRGDTPDEFNSAYDKAKELYEAALVIFESSANRDEKGRGGVFKQLGEIYADGRHSGHDPARAEKLLREAYRIGRESGDPRLEESAAYQLARFLRRRDIREARALFRKAGDLAGAVGLVYDQAPAQVQVAEIDFAAGQYDPDALDALLERVGDTLRLAADAHNRRVESDAYYLRGRLWEARGDLARARDFFGDARGVVKELAARSGSQADARRIARATVRSAAITLRLDSPEAARVEIDEHQTYFSQLGYGPVEDVKAFLENVRAGLGDKWAEWRFDQKKENPL